MAPVALSEDDLRKVTAELAAADLSSRGTSIRTGPEDPLVEDGRLPALLHEARGEHHDLVPPLQQAVDLGACEPGPELRLEGGPVEGLQGLEHGTGETCFTSPPIS